MAYTPITRASKGSELEYSDMDGNLTGLAADITTKVDKVSGKGLSDSNFTAAEKTKLNTIAQGATENDTDINLKNRSNHTGTQAISTVTNLQTQLDSKQPSLISSVNLRTINGTSLLGSGDITVAGNGTGLDGSGFVKASGSTITYDNTTYLSTSAATTALNQKVDKDGSKVLTDVNFTSVKDTKLSGISSGATVNDTDANLRNRANHTGVAPATSITQDTTHRFVTDSEKSTWNSNVGTTNASNLVSGTLSDSRLSANVALKVAGVIPIESLPEGNLYEIQFEEFVDSSDGNKTKIRIKDSWLSAYVDNKIANAGGNTTPAAPTAFVTDDTAKTANWTNASGFTNITDYEKTFDGGTTVSAAGTKPFNVIGAKAIGQVGVRVKGITGRNPSSWLFNTVAFTASSSDLLSGFTLIDPTDETNGTNITLTGNIYTTQSAVSTFIGKDDSTPFGIGSKLVIKYSSNTKGLNIGVGNVNDLYTEARIRFEFDSITGVVSVLGKDTSPVILTTQPTSGQYLIMERLSLTDGSGNSTWKVGITSNGTTYIGTPQTFNFTNYIENENSCIRLEFTNSSTNELDSPQYKA